ncbi:hypothetical protein [Haloquadratum walsbyi]|uniref:Uncharacterized protein n=1 Tax=Haloquadratum walsbyi J07HQW2 TaxID=1238425 RepID=U1PQV9_9EURY|nr:hypothetical protein [Haloquadratum walsbyi]ERG96152.1 MAG: hypothetical protein J07HQW2_02622 [Haloquadratum walsbyi J07HQW2]
MSDDDGNSEEDKDKSHISDPIQSPIPEFDSPQPTDEDGFPTGEPAIGCIECQSALREATRETTAFLLLDALTIPIVGCSDHREEFASVCGLTSDEAAQVVEYLPAGGVNCPSCQLAPRTPNHPVIPIGNGGVAILACSEHQSELINRFQTGLATRDQLTTSLDTIR